MTEHEQHGEYHGLHSKQESKQKLPLPVIIAAVAIVCLLVGYGAAVLMQPAKATGAATPTPSVDTQQLRTTVVKYLNDIIELQGGAGITVQAVNSSLENGMISIGFNLIANGSTLQSGKVFVSPDGKQLFLSAPLDLTTELPKPTVTPPVEMKKTDKPKVEMYVMSFCPYGIQAEQGIGPATGLLNGTITFEPHFIVGGINSSLHGPAEAHEDARQLCVLKYNRDKWWKYVDYINNNCNVDDVETCWKTAANNASINVAAIEKCFKDEGETLINAEVELTNSLGIGSSPTILINGVEYQGGRSPEAFKQGICSAFNTQPSACSQNLTSTASASTGSC